MRRILSSTLACALLFSPVAVATTASAATTAEEATSAESSTSSSQDSAATQNNPDEKATTIGQSSYAQWLDDQVNPEDEKPTQNFTKVLIDFLIGTAVALVIGGIYGEIARHFV